MAQFVKNLASSKRTHDAFQQLNWTKDTDLSISPPITLSLPGRINTWAYDPIQSLFACATSSGEIHVWGAPSVYISWSVMPRNSIKNLAFAYGRGVLVAIDSKDSIHIYSLSEFEKNAPKQLFVYYLRSNVLCIEMSPSLDHMFIGFMDGTVETFDIDRLCVSPYRISNLWLVQEEVLRRSGVSNAPSRRHIPMCIDMALNPVNLNQLLIAYEGGIVLYDIKESKSLASYDLVLAPGAAGSGNDPPSQKFTERRPPVTCVAWKPDGLIFAAGHLDGCISFWASQDADRPIMVRTMDRSNVDMPTEEDIFDTPDDDRQQLDLRDPIYRLAWSGFPEDTQSDNVPRNGGTTLTIFGGLRASQPKGFQIMTFPRFDPPSLAAHKGDGLSSAERSAYKDAVTSSSTTSYQTKYSPQDFILLPRSNPHFSMCYDPTSILLMFEPPSIFANNPTPRCLVAYEFPPVKSESDKILLDTSLPLPERWNWSGDASIISSQLYSTSHNKLQTIYDRSNTHSLFQGGKSSPAHGGNVDISRKASRLPGRLLVSHHEDGYIRFWDCSEVLLASPESSSLHNATATSTTEKRASLGASVFSGWLKKPFPRLLNKLKVPCSEHYAAETIKFHFSCEQLFCAVALPNGVIHIFRHFFPRDQYSMNQTLEEENLTDQILDDLDEDGIRNPHVGDSPVYEPVQLKSLNVNRSRFEKVGKLLLPSSKVDLLNVSDFGFLTATWDDEVAVLDIGEEEVFWQDRDLDKKRKGKEERGNICSLSWTVSSTSRINHKALRLLCAYQDGTFQMFTFNNTLDTWHLSSETDVFQHKGVYNSFLTVVLNSSGTTTNANTEFLANMAEDISLDDKDLRAVLIVVTSNSIYAFMNIDGSRAKMIESRMQIVDAKIIRLYNGNTALMAFFADGSISGYTLPQLDSFSIQLSSKNKQWSSRDIAICDDGSYISYIDRDQVKLHTIGQSDLGVTSIYPPALHLHDSTLKAPTHPCEFNAIASTISSWFGGVSVAEAVDSTLGGPTRPPPKEPIENSHQVKSLARVSEPLTLASASASTSTQSLQSTRKPQTSQASLTERASKSATSAVQMARNAIEERGEHLNRLSESLNDMSRSSKNALDEAKFMAFKESAKGKVRSWF